MASLSSSPKIVKAGFVYFDSPSAKPKIIAFPYNPETLSRTLTAAATLPIPTSPMVGASAHAEAPPSSPMEVISLSLVLDATEKLSLGDSQAGQFGMYPLLSALELLMYAPASAHPVVLFVFGPHSVLPVEVLSLQILEQLFDTALNPIQATVGITLRVLKDSDLPAGSLGRRVWDAHFEEMQRLAQLVFSSSLSSLGLSGLPWLSPRE